MPLVAHTRLANSSTFSRETREDSFALSTYVARDSWAATFG